MENHKCIDCGYLANRNKATRELVEVERGENGNINNPQVCIVGGADVMTTWDSIYDNPVCFARVRNIQSEIRLEPVETGPEDTVTRKIAGVITTPKPCDKFIDWQQGFTPKEHREMMDRKDMLEWQRKERHSDKVWRVIDLVALSVVALIAAIIGWFLRGAR